ncbi:MAG: double zinc ribbon domain-containing protein [Christensenellales bacterium]
MMAFYKVPCIHCATLLDRDVRFCPVCGSGSPFGYSCPTCLREIQKGQVRCAGCGRPLIISCPVCKQQTFVQERCEACGVSLMVQCQNRRCQQLQFFENTKCTACGKIIKKN